MSRASYLPSPRCGGGGGSGSGVYLRWRPPAISSSLCHSSRFCYALRSFASSSSSSVNTRSRRYGRMRRLSPARCARETKREDPSATDGKEETSSNSRNNAKDSDMVVQEPSSDGMQDMPSKTSSIRTVALWVCAAVTFGIAIGFKDGVGKASEFFAGYFKVPASYQSRVLSYGIAGAIFFRAIMILLGAATLQRFEAVNLLLASILLYSSYKLFSAEEEETDLADNFIVKTCQKFIPVTAYYDGDHFFTKQEGLWKATPLLLTVAVIELSDIAFAVDSIPAVFGVTRDPFIVFSSNLFAISGLRSLYILISESMSELEYLQPAIGTVLGFIGSKMILDFFGYHVSTELSLGFVATSLTIGVILSLAKKSD